MSEFETSAEMTEVAEPSESQSEETQEVAEPAEEGTESTEDTTAKSDAAFAEMRRNQQAAERRAQELEQQLQEMRSQQAASAIEQRKAQTYADIEKMGRANGLSDEEIADLKEEMAQDIEREAELERLRGELEARDAEAATLKAEQMMREDLEAIQKIAPEIKSLDELGETFLAMRTAVDGEGKFLLTAEQAYYAALACDSKLESMKPKAPAEPGFDDTSAGDKSYYTKEEVENMSSEQINAHFEAIQKSMTRW